jgi:hypothetical protein
MLAAIEAVQVGDVQRLAGELFAPRALGLTVLGNVNGLRITREQLEI